MDGSFAWYASSVVCLFWVKLTASDELDFTSGSIVYIFVLATFAVYAVKMLPLAFSGGDAAVPSDPSSNMEPALTQNLFSLNEYKGSLFRGCHNHHHNVATGEKVLVGKVTAPEVSHKTLHLGKRGERKICITDAAVEERQKINRSKLRTTKDDLIFGFNDDDEEDEEFHQNYSGTPFKLHHPSHHVQPETSKKKRVGHLARKKSSNKKKMAEVAFVEVAGAQAAGITEKLNAERTPSKLTFANQVIPQQQGLAPPIQFQPQTQQLSTPTSIMENRGSNVAECQEPNKFLAAGMRRAASAHPLVAEPMRPHSCQAQPNLVPKQLAFANVHQQQQANAPQQPTQLFQPLTTPADINPNPTENRGLSVAHSQDTNGKCPDNRISVAKLVTGEQRQPRHFHMPDNLAQQQSRAFPQAPVSTYPQAQPQSDVAINRRRTFADPEGAGAVQNANQNCDPSCLKDHELVGFYHVPQEPHTPLPVASQEVSIPFQRSSNHQEQQAVFPYPGQEKWGKNQTDNASEVRLPNVADASDNKQVSSEILVRLIDVGLSVSMLVGWVFAIFWVWKKKSGMWMTSWKKRIKERQISKRPFVYMHNNRPIYYLPIRGNVEKKRR